MFHNIAYMQEYYIVTYLLTCDQITKQLLHETEQQNNKYCHCNKKLVHPQCQSKQIVCCAAADGDLSYGGDGSIVLSREGGARPIASSTYFIYWGSVWGMT